MLEQLRTNIGTIKKYIRPVFYRNTVTLANIIFTVVTILLMLFKEIQEGLFLFSVVVLNSLIGTIQDMRAKIALENLQILMAPKVKRVKPEGGTEIIALESIKPGDKILVELGDQIPADGTVEASNQVEINEALLTGESANIGKKVGARVLAGSFVMAGSAVLLVDTPNELSFVSRMTSKLKDYTIELSPIQRTLTLFIQYMTYVLLVVIGYIIVSGISGRVLFVTIVKNIAALTGTLVPQGVILATTVFFAYGAVKLYKKQVLLQEINATEKLGRIKNLCVDKTGTLTENIPTLEQVITKTKDDESRCLSLAIAYFAATSDASHTAKAIIQNSTASFLGQVVSTIPFSSARKFGSATFSIGNNISTVIVGAPDILLPHIQNSGDKAWTEELIHTHAPLAKRLLLLTQNSSLLSDDNLSLASLEPLAMFILSNPLRAGTKDIINFFQDHGVRIRVISGDNPETVRAIAKEAGIHYTDLAITGPEMLGWDDVVYRERVPAFHIFARILPEQKEKIIDVLKTTGFTAMVGDGANDALAIKKADLGIAMFEGSSATRSIAQIVLMNNSFRSLPNGVVLADSIITNIELVASIFFNKVAIGLLLFIILASLGYNFPISSRNTTVISYFVIGLPIFYWALWPVENPERVLDRPFLKKILPYSLIQSFLVATVSLVVFFISPTKLQHGSNILVVLTQIALGISFFMLAPLAYASSFKQLTKRTILSVSGGSALVLMLIFISAGARRFFDLALPPLLPFIITTALISATVYLQYKITKHWFSKS